MMNLHSARQVLADTWAPQGQRADAIAALGAHLFSRSATLADVPPGYRGLTVAEWNLVQFAEWKAAAAAALSGPPEIARKAFSTPRDRYGMKGISTGTRML